MTLADGRQLSARVIARDPHNDLAVLEVDGDHLPAATIGDARDLRVGELGARGRPPFGIRNAVTVGVLSAKCPADRPNPAS